MQIKDSRSMRPDEPLMVAWTAYQETEEYKSTIRWAGECNKGNLWVAFIAGYKAAGGKVD
jgi:hypothetical protein